MLGIKFIKGEPNTYMIRYKNGRIIREGVGLSFLLFFTPATSIVSIPISSTDAPFIIKETTRDFQEVTVQGQVIYKITQPKLISEMLNFTLDPSYRGHATNDPDKLSQRVINNAQVLIRAELQKIPLREALRLSDVIVSNILSKLRSADSIKSLGVEILDLSILAIKPNPETARALEAEMREQLLKEADQAIFVRRNSAVENERSIKENELQTEMLIQKRRHDMSMEDINSRISLEEQNKQLVGLAAENSRVLADGKAYELSATLAPFKEIDSKVLEILALKGMDSSQLIAHAFKELSDNAEKIGQLNITPDLLKTLIENR